ncbi:MAG TPA: MotA/TolQ/ExbB proton channel family protein [Opitutales bacterium]|nr:MotA/TolQ/ExbB proton channel family protein [Opitutales bacterium]
MKNIFPWIFALTFFASIVSGQTPFDSLVAEREAKLEESLQNLRELREQIQQERSPLVRELNALDSRAEELADKVRQARRLRDSEAMELEALRTQVEARQREVDYVQKTLLPGFVANLDASMSPIERPRLGETMRNYNLFLENTDASDLDKLKRGLALIANSFQTAEELIGGQIAEGEALAPNGRIRQGTFVQTGPLVYFAEHSGEFAGLVDIAGSSLDAYVQPFQKDVGSAIFEVARTGEGTLPVDPTLGKAFAVEQTRDTISEHLIKGGVWVVPILLFALAATLVAITKSVQIFSIRHPRPTVIHEIVSLLKNGGAEEARKLAEAQPQPTRDMLVAAVDHAEKSTDMVEEVMYETMLTTHPKLERFLNVIAVTAAAAPLLGLLGTVTGIIKTFRLMTVFGAGDPTPLISGISEALITTELGLILAIPALVLHAILARKVAGIMAQMEKVAVSFVNALSRRRGTESVAS